MPTHPNQHYESGLQGKRAHDAIRDDDDDEEEDDDDHTENKQHLKEDKLHDQDLEDPEIVDPEELHNQCPPLPGHIHHSCTDVCFLMVFTLLCGGLFFPVQHALEHGHFSNFVRSFDYLGRKCGRDVPEEFEFYCRRIDSATGNASIDYSSPICVSSCPTDANSSHLCLDPLTNGTVLLDDYPTALFADRCIPKSRAISKYKKTQDRFKVFDDFSPAAASTNTFTGNALDGITSVRTAFPLLGLAALAATTAGYAFLLFLRACAAFLVYLSLTLSMVTPTLFGLVYLYTAYSSGPLGVLNVEVLQRLSIGCILTIAGCCMICFARRNKRGIELAAGTVTAAAECMFETPGLLIEPLMVLSVKIPITLGFVYVFTKLVSTGADVEMASDGPSRSLTFSPLRQTYLVYVSLMFIWVLEFMHAATQYTLCFTTQRWYFRPLANGTKPPLNSCVLFEAIGNMWLYHLGSIALGAFLISFLRPLHILAKCCPKAAAIERSKETGQSKSFVFRLATLKSSAFMDVAITSSNFCSAAQRAYLTMTGRIPATSVLHGAQFMFFLSGTCCMTLAGVAAVSAGLMAYPSYADPESQFFLTNTDAVLLAGAVVSFAVAVSIMNALNTVGDTIMYCFALEEQRFQEVAKTRPLWGVDSSLFQSCLFGRESNPHHFSQDLRYAPGSLRDLMDDVDTDE